MNPDKNKKRVAQSWAGVLLLCGMLCADVAAAGQPDRPGRLFDLSIEDLMDIPVVVSASRTEQKITHSSVPITIITAEDIHYSGATCLAEIFQLALGIDVVPLSRVRAAIGVRGLHDHLSDRTLVLINGRSAESPDFGGFEFYRMPILVEDIERIEIVRSPGGAAWGANAFTGVINIITRKPGHTPGWHLSSTVSEYGDTYSHVRWMGSQNRLRYRLSVGYEDAKDSRSAGAGGMSSLNPLLNPRIGFDDYRARDHVRNRRIDTEFLYDFSDHTEVTFGIGYSHLESGDWEFLGHFPGGGAWFRTLRNAARIDHHYGDGRNAHLQWIGNFYSSREPSWAKRYSSENALEVQYNMTSGEHHLTIGSGVRLLRIDPDTLDNQSLRIIGSPRKETFVGIFLIDRYQLTDALALEAQGRHDWYSGTHSDWSARLSALYDLGAQESNTLRFSLARAYRSPFSTPQHTEMNRVPIGDGAYLFNVIVEHDLDNEQTWALEAGYSTRLNETLALRTDAYYQRFENLIAYRAIQAGHAVNYVADNVSGADSWGGEAELAITRESGRLGAWYAYNDFALDKPGQPLRGYKPAQHKAGLTGRLHLAYRTTMNANYRYKSTTPIGGDTTLLPVSSDHRLGVTVARPFAGGSGQLMLGVRDVFNRTQGPNQAIGTLTAHEIPGRTFFARIRADF